MRTFRVFAVVCLVLLCKTLSAHGATSTGWQAVQALAPNTRVHIKADTRSSNCHITTVTEDKLTCSEGVFSRSEIKSIKLVDKTKSTLGGLALGAGIGAGAGAGIGSAINSGDTGSILHVSGGKSAGVGAAFGVIIGAGIGALVGHGTNLFATTIYKR
jgi:hypothetical protein